MKLTQIIPIVTAILLVISCTEIGTQQVQNQLQETDIDEIITLTSKQIDKEDYKSAAETITQVEPETFVEYMNNNKPVALDISVLITNIEQAGDEEATAILYQWGDKVEELIIKQRENPQPEAVEQQ